MPETMVRELKQTELPQLLELYRILHPADPPLDKKTLESLWDEINASSRYKYLVAEVDGATVSSCTLTFIPNLTRGAKPYGLIENVITHPNYRCKGLGTSILKHAFELAWQENGYKVMLMTGSKKPETLTFYHKAGLKSGIKTGFIIYPPEEFT